MQICHDEEVKEHQCTLPRAGISQQTFYAKGPDMNISVFQKPSGPYSNYSSLLLQCQKQAQTIGKQMAVAVVHKTFFFFFFRKTGSKFGFCDNSLSTSILEHTERMKVYDETVKVYNILMRLILISPFYGCENCGSEI